MRASPFLNALRNAPIVAPSDESVTRFEPFVSIGTEVRDGLVEELTALRACLQDAQAIVVDYSEGRIDSLVALGKIGLRILEVTE